MTTSKELLSAPFDCAQGRLLEAVPFPFSRGEKEKARL